MKENLFDYIDIPKENINIPDGTIAKLTFLHGARLYEDKIKLWEGLTYKCSVSDAVVISDLMNRGWS